MLYNFYSNLLKYPKSILTAVVLSVLILASFTFKVEIDASPETLLLQDDKDLAFSREIYKRYKTQDFLVVTYSPKTDLLSKTTLDEITLISKKLEALENVKSITSILNVPLLKDPSKSVKEMLNNIPTLQTKGINKALAKDEFLTSAFYNNHLVSKDFKTTAILVNLNENSKYYKLLQKRNDLLKKEIKTKLNDDEKLELIIAQSDFKIYHEQIREENHKTILDIRKIIKELDTTSELFLGGISMIVDDMVSFVRSDLQTYGVMVILLLISVVWIIFRSLRFVFLSVSILSLSVLAMTGFLGFFGWKVTVVSSNYISLQMIITMSLVVHLSVRYRELLKLNPDDTHEKIIIDTVSSMFKPCFYVIATSIAGFTSLVASNILPVINLGLMMSIGIFTSLVITFIVFPLGMVLFKKEDISKKVESSFNLTEILAKWTEHHKKTIFATSLIIMLFSISGANLLIVENSFIDYFKKDTEIYKGMRIVDNKLGGTTPLDIIINFPEEKASVEVGEEIDEFDEFEDEFLEKNQEDQYWFTSEKMKQIEQVHDYLDSLASVGKVLSFATTIKVGRDINNGESLDNLELALLYNELPKEYKDILLSPYLSIEDNQVRFSVRIIDSMPDLRRNELLKQIKKEIHEKVGIPSENIRLANVMVMYNNMLQSLFKSQVMTLGIVLVVLFIMFLLFFKSVKIAFIATIANIIPVGVIFGFMGWVGIPLDMMTITIAAISLGIAVDDTIHYLHRFKIEMKKDGDYILAMHRSHESVGNAMYYTTVVIVIGFSVLMFSNFYPTIYFGLLTALAMLMAIIADLLLLPRLIIWIKPFKI